MEPESRTSAFAVTGDAYDAFMGRYARPLAVGFAFFAGVAPGHRALDVGCGPGALTGELVRRLGAGAVWACDPSASFVAACAERHPGAEVRMGAAERLPFGDRAFDLVLAQLVLHFVADPDRAASEFTRATAPGGTIAACVWDFARGMELLRAFWDAALRVDPEAPDEMRVMKFGGPGEIADWLTVAGLDSVSETELVVHSTYADFDELWSGLLAGVGPAGRFCVEQTPSRRDELRRALYERLDEPTGPFTLEAVARAACGRRAD